MSKALTIKPSPPLATIDREKLTSLAVDGVHNYLANTKQEEFFTRERKLSAMRIGLLGVLISQEHGAWNGFIDSCKGIEGMSTRTLGNFKSMASAFLADMKLLQKKKLTEGGGEQLELWTREADTLEAKAREWMGERSLSEIYDDVTKKATRLGGHQSTGPVHDEDAERERAIFEAEQTFNEFQQWALADGCAHVDETLGARLSPTEAAEKELSFTVGLLSDEHLEAGRAFAGQLLSLFEHHQLHRAGGAKVKRVKRG